MPHDKYGYAVDDSMAIGVGDVEKEGMDDKFISNSLNEAGDKLEKGTESGFKKDMKKQEE